MTPRELAIAGAARPEGIGAKDLGIPRTTASCAFLKLKEEGRIFKGGNHMEMRYFDTPEKAQAFTDRIRIARAPMKRSYVAMGKTDQPKKPSRVGWGRDDPMHITKDTKYTVAPKPPERVYRTNTFA